MVSFSDSEWSPELVELCLRFRRKLEELCLWGIESGEWPPRIGTTSVNSSYPKNMNLLTTRADFQRAWRSLSRKERHLLDLYYMRGKTQEEIAPQMDCKRRNIGYLIEKARARMETFLGCHCQNGSK